MEVVHVLLESGGTLTSNRLLNEGSQSAIPFIRTSAVGIEMIEHIIFIVEYSMSLWNQQISISTLGDGITGYFLPYCSSGKHGNNHIRASRKAVPYACGVQLDGIIDHDRLHVWDALA